MLARLVLVLPVALFACSGSRPAKIAAPATTSARTQAPEPAPSEVPSKTTSISRTKIKETVRRGLGVFLQGVTLDDWPVLRQGKFYGFRIRAIHADWGVDLRPGDVVVRVNGMPIEHPEEADAAMRSLEKSPSLRVDYERDGKARVLELPIVDDVPQEKAAR